MQKIKELRGLIYGLYDSESALAKKINWDKRKLNRITNGKKEPNIEEINTLANALNTNVADIVHIFLQYKSPNEQRKETA